MAIFHSYVGLPEGTGIQHDFIRDGEKTDIFWWDFTVEHGETIISLFMWDSTNIQWGLLSEYWGLPLRRLLLVVSSKPGRVWTIGFWDAEMAPETESDLPKWEPVKACETSSGWWLQSLWKMMEFVSCDDYSPIYGQIKFMFQTTNQISH